MKHFILGAAASLTFAAQAFAQGKCESGDFGNQAACPAQVPEINAMAGIAALAALAAVVAYAWERRRRAVN